jgi:hypothetical protein
LPAICAHCVWARAIEPRLLRECQPCSKKVAVRRVALLLLAGCNSLLGLEQTQLVDARIIDPNNPDAYRPVLPPDGATACDGAPSFESWTYESRTIPFEMQVATFGLYATGTATHLVVTPTGGSGIWDVDLAGSARQITGLTPPAGRSISAVAVSPDGSAIWFKIEGATYVALRATGFQRELTELGVPGAYEVIPAAAGFYDGTLRMVVRLRDTISSGQAYVELSSSDGVSWMRGETLPFGGVGYFAAALSPDGCTLTLARMEGGSSYKLYYAYRDGSGRFGPLVALTAATAAAGSFPINPVIGPRNTSLWFSVVGQGLFEGHP